MHDAVDYLTTEGDLARAIETAWRHCRPGGAALFCPSHTRETFRPDTSHGGHDRMLCSLRYLEWTRDPGPDDTTIVTDFAYLLSDATGVRVEYDRHVTGLFPRATWAGLLTNQGFIVSVEEYQPSVTASPACDTFVCARPGPDDTLAYLT